MPNLSLVQVSPRPESEWRVAESFAQQKYGRKFNEDLIVIDPFCNGVIDGVTTAGNPHLRTQNDRSPGEWMSLITARSIKLAARFDGKEEITPYVTRQAAEALEEERVGYPSCVAALHLTKHNCIWRIGDPNVVIDGTHYPAELTVDKVKGKFRADYLRELRQRDIPVNTILKDDPTWRMMVALTEHWQMEHYTNSDDPEFGYGVINGTRIPDRWVEFIPVPSHARRIIIASDGYPACIIRDTIEETEKALFEFLRWDPLCISEGNESVRGAILDEHGNYHPYDDRSIVILERTP